MMITRENYEPYFIDYLEGSLDENLIDEFIAFIQENKDLKEELLLLKAVILDPDSTKFEKKENLYKEKFDSEKEFELASIALIEGDLSEKEITEFEDYLSRKPQKRKEADLFTKTRLHPDMIVFQHKEKLYKRTLAKTVYLWSARIAAVLVLAFIVSTLLLKQQNNIVPENQQVKNNNILPGKNKSDQIIDLVKPEEKRVTRKAATVNKEPELPVNKSKSDIQLAGTNEALAVREKIETPEYIIPLKPGLKLKEGPLYLAEMKPVDTVLPVENQERLLVDVIKESIQKKGFSFSKLARSGLNLASKISNDKFTYATNQDGKVTGYAFESRLIGISVPSGKK